MRGPESVTMFENRPAVAGTAEIERRAERIPDPVERLRYLREATDRSRPGQPRHMWNRVAPAVLALAVVPLGSDAHLRVRLNATAAGPALLHRSPTPAPPVWLVEQTSEFEVYSNGLRIERRFEVAHEQRSYQLIGRASGETVGALRTQPAGIVFHTTESDQAPFEAEQNHNLKRIGRELLLYIRNKRAYHFVIDRFGRVHRVVVESDTANHAGHSVWADGRWVYLNLNGSFLGIAFEAQTHSKEQPITQAQLHAAKVLVDMLRDKYNLSPENCVTHAQVSVNPDNMQIGWHIDWGTGFPFEQLGLPNNYEHPNPGLSVFGFEYNENYRKSTSPDLWRGLALAEEQMRESAAEHGLKLAEYRRLLHKKYREQISALRERNENEEN